MYSEFSEALARLEAITSARWPTIQGLQARYEAQLRAEYKRLYPKRKQPAEWYAVRDKLPAETVAAIYDPLKAEADKLCADNAAAEREAEAELQRLAADLPLPIGDKLRPRLFYEVDSGRYSTQGYGACKYARDNAEREADKARLHGLGAEVHELAHLRISTSSPGWGGSIDIRTYGVLIDTTPLGYEILKRKPELPLREYVRRCWKRGVNPRVMMPFLPHGYEEQVGLDYFGGEIRAA